MVQSYDYVRLNANTRSEFLLAIQYAENNGFPVHPNHVCKIKTYNGGPCVVNVHLKLDCTGVARRFARYAPYNALNVTTLDAFKHAVNCFCHDGYLNDTNLGEI